MNEFVRGFRSQSGICRCHRKDIEIGIKIKRSGFCPPALMALVARICRGSGSRGLRDCVRTLYEWVGTSGKYPDGLDPYGCVKSESSKRRTTGWLESAPF